MTTPLSAFRDACQKDKDLASLFKAMKDAALHLIRAECDGVLQKNATGEISTDVDREIDRNRDAFAAAKSALAEKAAEKGLNLPDDCTKDDVFQLERSHSLSTHT